MTENSSSPGELLRLAGRLETSVARLGRAVYRRARHPVVRALWRRLALALPLLFIVSVLTFALTSVAPGDAARGILGPIAPPSAYVQLRHALGLDLPVWDQYWRWLQKALSGDLGTSLVDGGSVTHEIAQRLPITLTLVLGGLLVSTIGGVAFGIFSALRGGFVGRLVDATALVGFALPAFWVGVELISVFAVKLDWLPATGYVTFSVSPTGWMRSIALPVVALAIGGIAAIAKQTREAMLEELSSEHVRMAWANGTSARSIYFRHALKGAGIRIVTVVGVQAVGLLGGSVFVENVFALPGLGSQIVSAASQHDIPVVQGVALVFTVIVVAINFAIDLVYNILDPRVRETMTR